MGKLHWGILSTANIGIKRVIPAIIGGSTGEVVAIASRDAARAAQVAAQFGIARSYGSYQALLDDPAVEAIYNPLPNHLHVEWSVKAMHAGKHVLCEKPIGLNADEARALVTARDATDRQIVEAFMFRYHPQWQRIRGWIREGRIGELRAIQSAFLFTMLDPANVRNQAAIGGGALYDVGCYPLVMARYLFESEPVRVMALVDRDPTMGVDRLTSGLLEFPGGRQLVFSSALQLATYQRATLLGSRGRIEIAVPFTPARDHACRLVLDTGASLDGSSAVTESLSAVDQYAEQCDRAAAIFRGTQEQEFPIEDALATMRVIDGLYRSAQTGRWETPSPSLRGPGG